MSNEELILKSKKEKKNRKEQKEKKEGFKKFFFGIGKEFKRITWISKKELFNNFFIVLALIIIFAAIFTGLSILMINLL